MTAVAPSLRPVPTPARAAAHRRRWSGRWPCACSTHIRNGELVIVEDGGVRHRFGSMATFPVRAVLRVHRASFYRSLLRGSIGAARSYAEGAWDCDDLVALVRLAIRNLDTLDRLQEAMAPVLRPLRSAGGWLHRNTRERSRENIAQHYDIGNDLFELMLDDTMSYSNGIFETPALHACTRRRSPRSTGSAASFTCRPPTTSWRSAAAGAAWRCTPPRRTAAGSPRPPSAPSSTASPPSASAGTASRIASPCSSTTTATCAGSFTKLVSVEMIEAIGWQYFDTYFAVCSRLLTADGLAAIQAICQPHRAFLATRGTSTFINAQIFPGRDLPVDRSPWSRPRRAQATFSSSTSRTSPRATR